VGHAPTLFDPATDGCATTALNTPGALCTGLLRVGRRSRDENRGDAYSVVALRLLGAPDNAASPPANPHDTTPNFEEIVIAMLDEQPKPDYARELLGRYVSEPVASQALEGASLEGAMVQASAMFVDLCGFTALTRRLPASEVWHS
jgi:hypothetical protein